MSELPLLDTRTIGFLFALNSVAIALAIFFSASNYPKAIAQSLMVSGSGKILIAIGFTLVGMRGLLPMTWTVLAANVLVVGGVYTNYMSIRIIFGRSANVTGLVLACALVMANALYFLMYAGDLRGMRIVTSLVVSVVMGTMAN